MGDGLPPELEPGERPAFLDKKKVDSMPYPGVPDAIPVFDYELVVEDPSAPVLGVQSRYREIARRHAHGQTNNQIAAALGYTASRLSIILRDPFVQSEIERWRETFFDGEAVARLKEAARDGAVRIHGLILNPRTEDRVALAASQFAVEKAHGKAKQEVSVQSESLTAFMDLLRDLERRGDTLDVTPKLPGVTQLESQGTTSSKESVIAPNAPPSDKFTAWISENL